MSRIRFDLFYQYDFIRKEKLPRSNGNRTVMEQLNALLKANPTPVAYFHIPIITPFDYVNRKKGLILLLSPQEAKVIRSKQRRYQPPKCSSIKGLLQRGVALGFELSATPGITRAQLARRHGIEPSYLSRLLHLTNLAPEIQEHIRNMRPTAHAGPPITLRRLVPLARSPDHRWQLQEFKKLLLLPARIRKTRPTEALSSKINGIDAEFD